MGWFKNLISDTNENICSYKEIIEFKITLIVHDEWVIFRSEERRLNVETQMLRIVFRQNNKYMSLISQQEMY